ncbi:MAG: hypothetical protein COX57_09910 [Alphaproteobacteria bacterium CG_4_10_14_0_2_um_filter_63_37]|nr:MAG: hypothetical protein COX57_09910 [Alphaproteobacteria bacterium CG_4_10_14_0_2_um_filter_63_37]
MNPVAPPEAPIPPRNLYLGGEGTPLKVSRREGALVVSCPGAAERWFPLGRVACLHIAGGTVTLESDALLACLERGIAVVFQGSGGHELGMTVPMGRPGQRLGDNLEFLRSRPDAAPLLADWLAAAERQTILATCRTLGHIPPDLRPQRVQRWLLEQLPIPIQTRVVHARRAFVHWMALEIATLWGQEGLDPRLLTPLRHGDGGVGAALTRLIAWDFEVVLRRSVAYWPWAERLASGEEHWHMLQVFENQRPHWHRLTQGWLDALDWWLEGVL